MYKKTWLLSLVLLFSLILMACGSGADEPALDEAGEALVSHGNEIGEYVELVDALRAAGATVEPVEEIEQPFFSVPGQIIRVDGNAVQVFEYADNYAREAESEQIAPDGSSIGTSMVSWMDTPHFWAKGQVIALYVGQDQATIDLLTGVLGAPVTENG